MTHFEFELNKESLYFLRTECSQLFQNDLRIPWGHFALDIFFFFLWAHFDSLRILVTGLIREDSNLKQQKFSV